MEGRREIEGEERRKGETEGRKEGRRNESYQVQNLQLMRGASTDIQIRHLLTQRPSYQGTSYLSSHTANIQQLNKSKTTTIHISFRNKLIEKEEKWEHTVFSSFCSPEIQLGRNEGPKPWGGEYCFFWLRFCNLRVTHLSIFLLGSWFHPLERPSFSIKFYSYI